MRSPEICLALAIVASSYLNAEDGFAQLSEVNKDSFGTDYSGRIAIIKNARNETDARAKYDYSVFPRSGEFKLPASDRAIWFVINHYIKQDVDEADDQSDKLFDPSFIGIQIVSYYKGATRPSAKVYLYRNKNWIRSQESTFNGRIAIGKSFANRTVGEFLSFHTDQNSACLRSDAALSTKCAKEFDSKFTKWHAQVEKESDDSWTFGINWNVDGAEANNVLLKNYLIRFTPKLYDPAKLLRPSTSKPLLFSTENSSLQKLRIRTFAPTFEYSPDLFDNDITLVFE